MSKKCRHRRDGPEVVIPAEQRLLGDDDEAARFAACQPFTREIAVEGTVKGSFDASLAAAAHHVDWPVKLPLVFRQR